MKDPVSGTGISVHVNSAGLIPGWRTDSDHRITRSLTRADVCASPGLHGNGTRGLPRPHVSLEQMTEKA